MSLVKLQQKDTNGNWINVKVTNIQTSEDDIIVLGKTFRILVDDEEVYQKGRMHNHINDKN